MLCGTVNGLEASEQCLSLPSDSPPNVSRQKGGIRNHNANRYGGCPEEQIADGKLRFAFDWTGWVPGLLGFRHYLFSMYLHIGSVTGSRHIQSDARQPGSTDPNQVLFAAAGGAAGREN